MASSAIIKLWATVKDNVGRVAKTAIQIGLANWNPAGTVAAAWKVVLENLIGVNGVVEQQSTAQSASYVTAVTPAPRCNREDKATMVLPDANGIDHVFKIPTPILSIATTLGSDKINLTDSIVLAYVSAMTAHAVTPDDVAFSGVITGGKYIKHKSEKKGGY